MRESSGKTLTVEEAYAYAVLALNHLIKERVLLPGPDIEWDARQTPIRAHYHCLNQLPLYMHKYISVYSGETAIGEAKVAKGHKE